jgi:hypothetical protein
MRRAEAGVTVTTSEPSPSIRLVTSSPTFRRAATMRASATVPAEIRMSSSASSAAMQASASFSSRTIAIRAEMSTAINGAGRHPRRGNPGSARRTSSVSCPLASVTETRMPLSSTEHRRASFSEIIRLFNSPNQWREAARRRCGFRACCRCPTLACGAARRPQVNTVTLPLATSKTAATMESLPSLTSSASTGEDSLRSCAWIFALASVAAGRFAPAAFTAGRI